ncbi:MAG TPA: gluconate 2-dehydrogenase subunit 3 family protein [Blastocatellia bacterium]|nr:gluconate 2-dehydrogenase subunit 3 family protein [Blastocatellia bacterium]
MDKEEISRRLFLIRSCAGVGAAWLSSRWPEIVAAQEHAHSRAASAAPVNFEFFTPEEAAEVEAIAAQIIPTDDTPGAREARVIYFIDRALKTFDSDKQPLYKKGLLELQAKSKNPLLGAKKFSDLKSENQIKVLKGIQLTPFFQQVRAHTIMGFLSNPEYGGNYDQIGWKHIGFEDRFFHNPPFGYYDREYKEK